MGDSDLVAKSEGESVWALMCVVCLPAGDGSKAASTCATNSSSYKAPKEARMEQGRAMVGDDDGWRKKER